MNITLSKRVRELKPYVFSQIDASRSALEAKGVSVVNLGIGDPDSPTCNDIIKALKRECMNPKTHCYPTYDGRHDFRQAVADYYKWRYSADIDPDGEVITLIGSKEGIFHAPLAFVDPGDVVLVPDPCYPIFESAVRFAGGVPYMMPLLEENGFLPNLLAIPAEVLARTKAMFLNYPNNPTGAVAPVEFLDRAIGFCTANGILMLYDHAYGDIYTGSVKNAPVSPLSRPGGKEVCLEFNSLSKPFAMTGWRIGYALGRREAVQGLLQVKKNVDSGVFEAIQIAGRKALTDCGDVISQVNERYTKRKEVFAKILNESGWNVPVTEATFYIWTKVPSGDDDVAWCTKILEEAHVVATPGSGFGIHGKGYLRFAMTASLETVERAAERIAAIL